MDEPRLRATALGHWHRPDAWLFRNVDLAVHAGRALAVLGPNGRGKSTLLRALAGLVAPREGAVRMTGRHAFVPAAVTVAFDYRALDMVLMGRAGRIGLFAQPSPADERAASAALARLEIGPLASRAFATLSGGERQMVLLARALASEADILLMDEPTAALDLRHQLWIAAWLRRLMREDGLSLVFATHDPNQAHEIATDVLLMHTAPALEIGPRDTLLTAARLSRLFDCQVARVEYLHGGLRRATFAVPPLETTAWEAQAGGAGPGGPGSAECGSREA